MRAAVSSEGQDRSREGPTLGRFVNILGVREASTCTSHSTDDAALPPMRLRQARPAPMPADVQWNGQPLQAFDWRWNAGTRVLRADLAARRGHLRVRRMCG